ncbi:septation ring formation regulator EzrA [Lactobacillus sp. YT155]|uniref:septation ring formation regulator EzrA n=1 Tax=Lactobacillus sp. YT155 TaxID=3060955 RepID=UPI00265E9929|nr:septation ring formation regulator EzrA [Lactobacillus sp. YT155]MDO1605250.1 septation ring formation regulator EzrA [Lactobacillus sp. YT155]
MALNIFIAIIILLILAIVFIWYMTNKNERDLIEVQDRIDLLKIGNLKKVLDELTKTQFTGASLKSFQEQQAIYNEIVSEKIPVMNAEVEEIQEDNSRFKVFSVHNKLKTKFQEIDDVKEEINRVNYSLTRLAESTKINASQSNELKDRYQAIRKQLLTKSFVYGLAAPKLEEELKAIELQFEKETELTQKGDHLEAKSLLDVIKKDIDKIDWKMNQIEPLYQELIDVFPGQLEEIESVYQKMKTQKYDFPSPGIEAGVISITDQIANTKEKISTFDFPVVKEQNAKIASEIDGLYSTLEEEANAKNEVQKTGDKVFEFLQHAKNQNDTLISSLKKISRDYILLNQEDEEVHSYQEQIYELIEQYHERSEEMATDSVIYSEILTANNQTTEKLTEIETKQKEIHENFQAMVEGVEVAKVSVNNYANSLKNQKLRIDQLRLLGLPKDYLDYYKMVASEINKMQGQLNEPKINVDEVSKQSFIVQEDLSNLEQKTDELVNNVKLTEIAIQYANRYVNSDEEVREASQNAKRLFDQDFDYTGALNIIGGSLEKVEPGSMKRLQDSMGA